MIPVDLGVLLPTIVVAIMGWLIQRSFKAFEERLDSVDAGVKELVRGQHQQEIRHDVLTARLKEKGVLS